MQGPIINSSTIKHWGTQHLRVHTAGEWTFIQPKSSASTSQGVTLNNQPESFLSLKHFISLSPTAVILHMLEGTMGNPWLL